MHVFYKVIAMFKRTGAIYAARATKIKLVVISVSLSSSYDVSPTDRFVNKSFHRNELVLITVCVFKQMRLNRVNSDQGDIGLLQQPEHSSCRQHFRYTSSERSEDSHPNPIYIIKYFVDVT